VPSIAKQFGQSINVFRAANKSTGCFRADVPIKFVNHVFPLTIPTGVIVQFSAHWRTPNSLGHPSKFSWRHIEQSVMSCS
jgi:hypothetical protein